MEKAIYAEPFIWNQIIYMETLIWHFINFPVFVQYFENCSCMEASVSSSVY